MAEVIDLYGGRDPRELPAYTFVTVAETIGANPQTVRNWAKGHRTFRPILTTDHVIEDDDYGATLSFYNLIEAFVLHALRTQFEFSLQQLRKKIDFMRETFPAANYPLAQVDLYIQKGGQVLYARYGEGPMVDLNQAGQQALDVILRGVLKRVEKDPTGGGYAKFFPIPSYGLDFDAPKVVEINPRVSFGRPVLVGTGVPTRVIADRFAAGDDPEKLAGQYGKTPETILEVIRYEYSRKAA